MLAVVPLRAVWPKPAPFLALLIGSMVPDWPLFVPFGPTYVLTHTLGGAVTVCVVLGLSLYLAFHKFLKIPLSCLLPDAWRRRVQPLIEAPHSRSPLALVEVALALALGALSHVVWDAFTHQGRWGVSLLPSLNDVVFSVGGFDVQGFRALQHGSSLLGLPLLVALCVYWFRSVEPAPAPPNPLGNRLRGGLIVVLLLLPALVGLWTLVASAAQLSSVADLGKAAHIAATRMGLALACLLVIYGSAFNFRYRSAS